LSTKRSAISRKTRLIAHFDDRHIAIAGICLYDMGQLAEPANFYRGHQINWTAAPAGSEN
jgi:hypothetical protein